MSIRSRGFARENCEIVNGHGMFLNQSRGLSAVNVDGERS